MGLRRVEERPAEHLMLDAGAAEASQAAKIACT